MVSQGRSEPVSGHYIARDTQPAWPRPVEPVATWRITTYNGGQFRAAPPIVIS